MAMILLYVSINHRGGDARWYPVCRDIELRAIPRIGEAICLKGQDYFEQMTVKNVVYAESGEVVVELDGEEFTNDSESFEVSIKYHHDLGFHRGCP